MGNAVAGEPFIIFGAGGHGKVVADLIRALGHLVAGYVDQDPAKQATIAEPGGAKVIGLQSDVLASGVLPAGATKVAIAIGNNAARLELLDTFGEGDCPALVHPSAVVSPSAKIAAGTVVFPGAIINANAAIGRACIINTGVVVEHDCVVGDGTHVSPNATLCGAAKVGRLSWIGAGSTVVHTVSVGHNAVVGAGTVIIRDVPDNATVVGNPGRVIKQNDT